VKRYGKYGRKVSWILKWFGKYGRKDGKDMKNTAILFSLSVSYNLIIFYELALSLVICPFPAILFS
jgi:hypothetical protein